MYCGYPGRFRKNFCFVNALNKPYASGDSKADILMGHFRFDDEVKQIMNPLLGFVMLR